MDKVNKLEKHFYMQDDVVSVAKQLLGKILVSNCKGHTTKGMISETEAYNGVFDKACHAYNGKRTKRNNIMFGEGGSAYIYLCYGIHSLFNVVVSAEGIPNAVLIRTLIPLEGIEVMKERRGVNVKKNNLCKGPGCLSKAMGLSYEMNTLSLVGDTVYIQDIGISIDQNDFNTDKRIGIDYAKEDALLPYRFILKPCFYND